ncbi:hypothetical protein [Paenibacillus popilliae]|uniref:Uncharacterized protein n=1 Tax=Paenibacillus popilliae ATCC 14706 TaxID=1212764 RepID=M9LQ32_PAEPP|nr:hypothetical protein [Paenibacillus popilliae]GAC42766.1 hypothetical protein PPOP_2126 [Paenibacillus popilliae ATCC 14706]
MGRQLFPPDVEEYLHKICLNAILRAIESGAFKPPEERTNLELLQLSDS